MKWNISSKAWKVAFALGSLTSFLMAATAGTKWGP